jgi:membrane peptidoglycan carboxypeptidase
MIDLISAYGAIANRGILVPRSTILEVYNPAGEKIWPLEDAEPNGKRVVSAQAAFIMTDILASNTDPDENPFWSLRAIRDGGTRRPATLKTGTTDATIDLTAVGYLAPPKDPDAPALVVGTWMGNSDNSAPPQGVFALESAASLWQSFLTQASKGMPIADFRKPAGVVQAKIDAHSGMRPGPFTSREIEEWFIEGTVPKKADNTKVGIEIDKATGDRWKDGCAGPQVVRGFLDLSDVESQYDSWVRANQNWISRAARGGRGTTYFYQAGGWAPFGRSWGAPFPPRKTCEIPVATPTPPPSGEPLPTEPLPTDPVPPAALPPSPRPGGG